MCASIGPRRPNWRADDENDENEAWVSGEAGQVVHVHRPAALVARGLLLDQVDLLVRLGPALHVEDRSLVGGQDLEHVLDSEGLELLLGLEDRHGALQPARVQDLLHGSLPPVQSCAAVGNAAAHWFLPSSHSEACSSGTWPGVRLAAMIRWYTSGGGFTARRMASTKAGSDASCSSGEARRISPSRRCTTPTASSSPGEAKWAGRTMTSSASRLSAPWWTVWKRARPHSSTWPPRSGRPIPLTKTVSPERSHRPSTR